jgi:hypothetical protein
MLILLFFANKIETDEPSNILYAAGIEILIFDTLALSLLFRMIVGWFQ